MVSLSTSLKSLSPFSSAILSKRPPSKHNPNNLIFSSYNKPNSKLHFTKRLVVACKKPTFTAEDALRETTLTEESHRKVPFSEVVRKKRVFWERRWNYWDVSRAIGILGVHLLSLYAPFHFNWSAFRVAVGLSVIAGTGITLSYHRNLSHRSFVLPKWLEYLFAWCGTLAFQGDPIEWVSNHRYHHQYSDTDRDPHTPLHGFWFSYFLWIFDTGSILQNCGGEQNAADLVRQPFYRFLQRTWILNNLALSLLLYIFGGFPFLVWGVGVRTVFVLHSTFLMTAASHTWGTQPWKTGDLSKNTWWLAIVTLGESWHNNHHAFEFSARHGLEWWQIDITWYFIRLLQALGLATNVKLVTEAHKQRFTCDG
ncbi:hypothetical protein Bca4012_074076 [Brassica carinata]|uniref:(rape) hypothetical protein n=1 Tax=Brassica napus TaxID=3708 RepID=A0A078GUF6_BRANA|nr:unnamed protein product [Brassica napus]CDY30120.1 BnaC05g37420D [Brassica napus]